MNLKNRKLVLAPMAGVTNRAMRTLVKEQQADITISEMIHSRGLLEQNQKTKRLIDIEKEAGIVGLQLFGNDPLIMAKAAALAREKYNPSFIDINLGCPVPKVVRLKMGAALLLDPTLVGKIAKEVVNAVDVPVTVKIRMGWDRQNITGDLIAQKCQAVGVKGIFVHARTRDQFYQGQADWSFIKKIKELLTIPVIGNGDIFSVTAAEKMLKETSCDGLMIGRGALGNPWLFSAIKNKLQQKPLQEITLTELFSTMDQHLKRLIELRADEHIALKEMRKHFGWYLKGLYQGRELRNQIVHFTDKEVLRERFAQYKHFLEQRKPCQKLPLRGVN